MEISIFMALLAVASTLTGLITEALKKMTSFEQPNILAGIVSIVVGLAVGVSYALIAQVHLTVITIIGILTLVLFSWLCAMLGYDKVIQTIAQIKGEMK